MRKVFMAVLAVMLLGVMPAAGGEYRYVKQQEFRDWLQNGKRMLIVDIQEPAAFAAQHFRNSIETRAYPTKSDEERRRLDGAVRQAASTSMDVVIVCPRGGGGARNSYDYLSDRGIDEKRLFILEKGMQGWPYPELTVRK